MFLEEKINEVAQGQLRILELLEEALNMSKDSAVRWYTNEEAAELFKVSKRTLSNWRDNGKITFSQIGSKIYYSSKDVEIFMQKNHTY